MYPLPFHNSTILSKCVGKETLSRKWSFFYTILLHYSLTHIAQCIFVEGRINYTSMNTEWLHALLKSVGMYLAWRAIHFSILLLLVQLQITEYMLQNLCIIYLCSKLCIWEFTVARLLLLTHVEGFIPK